MKIQFLGAAGTVTGSKHLLQAGGLNILLDCGLFQGLKELRELNWEKFSFHPADIDLVLLTHGHLDHCGYLPRLVQQGFSGEIWCTAPTADIARIILNDSAKIQEEDAERANRNRYSRHSPALPLYDRRDVGKTLPLFHPQPPGRWLPVNKDVSCRFRYNGHILGATFIEVKVHDKIIVYSGDIGRNSDMLMYAPESPEKADVLIMESTYGDRVHHDKFREKLAAVIADCKGPLVIPGFAVERMQGLMHLLWELKKEGKTRNLPMYVDSPMGSDVFDLFARHIAWHKLPLESLEDMRQQFKMITRYDETLALSNDLSPKIIIAGSGMATGGRVLAYLRNFLPEKSATILLTGYQAEGTRGRNLLEGAPEIKLQGEWVPVKAKVDSLEGLSSHADQPGLINWLKKLSHKPDRIFLVHGEEGASRTLKNKISMEFGWDAEVPALFEETSLENQKITHD